MRIGSLCSGVDGLALGLERAGVGRTVWHAEVDRHASTVLAARWPGIPNHGDLKTACWERVEPVDLLVGGYPCQPFSSAGQRLGTADPRHLWPHVYAVLRVLRPRLALFENVAGHVSLGLDAVLRDLAAAGFDAEWGVVRASDVGAPHRRERIFILAADTALSERGGSQQQTVGSPAGSATELGERLSPPVADATNVGCEWGGAPRRRRDGPTHDHWGPYQRAIQRWEQLTRPAPEPADDGRLSARFVEWMMGFPEGFVTDLLPRGPALRCLGNAVVPQVAELVGEQLTGAVLVSERHPGRAHSDTATLRETSAVADNTYWPASDGTS